MESARPLRDVFAGLTDHTASAGDAGSSAPDLRSILSEYHDLPDDLLVTAISSYANTAPAEVAEHLAPVVTAPGADPAAGLDLLASAPVGTWDGEVDLPGAGDPPSAGDTDDPGLHLHQLDRADGLDLADNGSPFHSIDPTEYDLQGDDPHDGTAHDGHNEAPHGSEDLFGDGAGPASNLEFDSGAGPTTEPQSALDHLAPTDHPISMDPADPAEHYLDHQAVGQPTDLDGLDQLPDFDHQNLEHDGEDLDHDGLDGLDT